MFILLTCVRIIGVLLDHIDISVIYTFHGVICKKIIHLYLLQNFLGTLCLYVCAKLFLMSFFDEVFLMISLLLVSLCDLLLGFSVYDRLVYLHEEPDIFGISDKLRLEAMSLEQQVVVCIFLV